MSAVTSGRKGDTLQVNVVNMIDILIILLVFLLTNFATSTFEDTTSLPASMPVFVPDDGKKPPVRPEASQLEVRMTQGNGFTIIVRTEDRSAGTIDVALKEGGAFDFERLSDELLKIKQAYAARQDVILEADKRLPFDLVVKAMDAVREKIIGGGGGQLARMPLFPAVALTDLP